MSAQSPASDDLSPRAFAGPVAPPRHSHSQSPPTPTEAEAQLLASMSRGDGRMAFAQPRYTAPRVQPKAVRFELVSPESREHKARLPMRVQIFPHDTTDSIITTVKNFYGLYSSPTSSKGVSFEDDHGNTIIARYENFRHDMDVYVRVIEEGLPALGAYGPQPYQSLAVGAQPYYNSDGYPIAATQPSTQQHTSRPDSRASRRRSVSPNSGRGRRSASTSTNDKNVRSRSSKNRGTGVKADGDVHSGDSMNGYSSGDGAPGSSFSKSKEQIGNTEISLENIVEGGRRKRAKFESSVSRTIDSDAPENELRTNTRLLGIAPFRTSSNACCDIQSFRLAGSSPGTKSSSPSLRATWP